MNQLIILMLLILVIQFKKTDYNAKIIKTEKKFAHHDHDKYITTKEFNKLTTENFAARLAQANFASKSYIANFVKKTDFHDKLKILNEKKLHQTKKKHVLVENELNELSKKVKAISTKILTKDLINKFSILNDAKYLSGILQNYFIFKSAKEYIKYFSGTIRMYS